MLKIIKPNAWKETSWSGGKTNEVFIYPEGSNYAIRDFKFRLSIATTEAEESNFTPLPNVNRIISVLEGSLLLKHNNHHTTYLHPYDIDRFSGDWDTFAQGKVKDFNLMIKNGQGNFYFKIVNKEDVLTFKEKGLYFIFCIDKTLKINNLLLEKNHIMITDKNTLSLIGDETKIFYGYIEV